MKRNPVYVFENRASLGIYNVPVGSMVQINDADGQGGTKVVQIISKDGLHPYSTIAEFLYKEENYEVPSQAGVVTKEMVGKPDGVAPLDHNGMVPGVCIPTMDINDVYVVNTTSEMIQLQANTGDVCVVAQEGKTYINNGGLAGDMTDWTEMLTQSGTVTSVNSKTGNVVLNADDVSEGMINKYFNDTNFGDSFSNKRMEELADVGDVQANVGDVLTWSGSVWKAMQTQNAVQSVNNKTGVVVLTTDDINVVSGSSNEYYSDTKVEQVIQRRIDDAAGIGDTNILYSADKIAKELSYKAVIEDPAFRGILTLDLGGQSSDSSLNIINSKFGATGIKTVIESDKLYFADSTGKRYSIRLDDTTQKLDFRINDISSLSIEEGLAPSSQFQPTLDGSLTRKDYVDNGFGIIYQSSGFGTDGSYSPDQNSNFISSATSLFNADQLIDTAVKTNADAILSLQTELNTTQTGSGLGNDGSYIIPEGTSYLSSTTSLASADIELDAAIAHIQAELDGTQTGAGLGTDGSYTANANANYISGAVDLFNADQLLDTAIKTNADNITTLQNKVAAAVTKITDPTTATTEEVANKINELIDSLTAAGLMA